MDNYSQNSKFRRSDKLWGVFYNGPLNVCEPPLLPHLPQHSSEDCGPWLKAGDSCPVPLQLFDM